VICSALCIIIVIVLYRHLYSASHSINQAEARFGAFQL